jgi:hypothetical protein
MHRLTARLLLLFALVGTFAPVALALSAAPPPHACCVRKTQQAHPCHGTSMAEPEQLTLRSRGCCHQDCCRGVTVARWAQAERVEGAAFAQEIGATLVLPSFDSPITEPSELQSTRAPPQSSIA